MATGTPIDAVRRIVAWAALASCSAAFAAPDVPMDAATDLLDYHASPQNSADHRFNVLFDAGAWHGYSLAPEDQTDSGFVGPFVHSLGSGQWVGASIAQLKLVDVERHAALRLTGDAGHAGPGYLQRVVGAGDLHVVQTLFFPDSWHAVVRIELLSDRAMQIDLSCSADLMHAPNMKVAAVGDHLVQKFPGTRTVLSTGLIAAPYQSRAELLSPTRLRLRLDRPLTLGPGDPTIIYLVQTLQVDAAAEHVPQIDPGEAWQANRQRWSGIVAATASAHLAGLSDQDARRVAAKAVVTLLGNWRAARGDLLHDGVVPSYSDVNYNGFWAWDSWKHVAALATVAPQLARSQLLAMFDYQDADGMVPDCIFMDHTANNNRDSKPPLAAWAALRLWRATGDRETVALLFDRLLRYHRWWYSARDHRHGGLAEYGSTDGTLVAAAWESGMDNAVRFDGAGMVRNGDHAWSLNQVSVDLNAYLFADKLALADLAAVIHREADRQQLLQEAATLKSSLQDRLFDTDLGYFFDRKLDSQAASGQFVRVFGPEGWIPLWAGAANEDQAQRVMQVMTNTKKFATWLPFPTLAADDPKFDPVKGYWRGTVWIDQAWFGIVGLRRYGFVEQANQLALRLVNHAEGVTGQMPFRETYDPRSGAGLNAFNFSWSAAHYLMLLNDPATD